MSDELPYSQGTNAALVRLRFAKKFEILDALQEVLDLKEGEADAAQIVLSKLEGGEQSISLDHLVELIARTRDPNLYAFTKYKFSLPLGAANLLKLYAAQYPDEEIETKLCEILWRTREDDSNWVRRGIAEAMAEIGSEAVLPVLEAINYELGPRLQAQQVFGEAIEAISDDADNFRDKFRRMLPGIAAKSRAAFLKSVASAIDAIKERVSSDKLARKD